MNPAEYEIMAAVEDHHWWYQGLRDLLARIVTRERSRSGDDMCVLDAGCGTGGNLQMLQAVMSPAYLGGFDLSEAAVGFSRSRIPQADVYVADIGAPEFHRDQFDVILCSDVLYTTGVESVRSGLNQLIARLKPGGLFVLHLPAFNWLYSSHDAAVHTRHRFRRREVVQLLNQLELSIERISYRMFVLFPLIVAARLPSLIFGATPSAAARSDLSLPPRPVNAALRQLVRAENFALDCGVPFPWGSSLIATGRKS